MGGRREVLRCKEETRSAPDLNPESCFSFQVSAQSVLFISSVPSANMAGSCVFLRASSFQANILLLGFASTLTTDKRSSLLLPIRYWHSVVLAKKLKGKIIYT